MIEINKPCYTSFIRLLGSSNFSGMVVNDHVLEKELVFIRLDIFWDDPIYFFVDFRGNLVRDQSTSDIELEDLFKTYYEEGNQPLFLIAIIDQVASLELSFINQVALVGFEVYSKNKKGTSIKNCALFYKQLSYGNITCYKMNFTGLGDFFFTRIWIYWQDEIDAFYTLLDSKGNMAKGIIDKSVNLAEKYRELDDLCPTAEMYLSEVLSCEKVDNLIWNAYSQIYN